MGNVEPEDPGAWRKVSVGTGFPSERPPWSVTEGILLFVAFVLIHQAADVASAFRAPLLRSSAVSGTLASVAVLVLLYIFVRTRSARRASVACALGLNVPRLGRAIRRAFLPVVIGCFALAGCMIARVSLLDHLNIRPSVQPVVTEMQRQFQQSNFLAFGALVFLAVVVAPLAEELTFRGMLYLPLRAGIGRVGGALVAALMFAALHMSWATPLENLAAMAYLTILALVLTELMEATGSMLAPVLAHAAHNALMVLFASLAAGGG